MKSQQAAFLLIVPTTLNIALVVRLVLAQQAVDLTDWNWNWNWNSLACDKRAYGYVGLRNLGATYYMNSLLQQFFMIPPLRKGTGYYQFHLKGVLVHTDTT